MVNRVLAALTTGAFLTLVLGASGLERPWPAIVLGAAFSVLSVVGFAWLRQQSGRKSGRQRLALALGYVAIQLPLSFAAFSAGDAAVGPTLLLLVLVCQSVLLLPLPLAAVVTAVVPLVHVGMTWSDGLREGLGTLAAAVFTAVVTYLLVREQRARADLADANEQLGRYAAQAEQLATTQERNRLARDIHDGLGHYLTVVQMQVQAARALLDTDPVRADAVLAKALQQSKEALAEVRRSVAALREPRSTLPLPDALEALVAETAAAGVPAELEVAGSARSLPAEAEESLYRGAQEGLTNVRKHARATRAHIVLDYSGIAAVRVVVRDDGSGCGVDAPPGDGFGLLGLRERASRLGGSVTMTSAPGQGSVLCIEVPG